MKTRILIHKHLAFALVVLLSASMAVSAQQSKETKLEKNLRAHVTYLASDALEGRRTGEKGAKTAADYIAAEFKKFGLTPGYASGGRKSFLQPFEFVSGVKLGSTNSLVINGSAVELKKDWMPIGYSPDADISSAGVVFAGFGITATDLKYDDYEGIDAEGKIVIVFAGTPDSGNPHSGFGRFGLHAKANVAKEHGAVSLIVISNIENFSDDKLAMRFDQRLGETAVPSIVVSRQKGAEFLGLDTYQLKEFEEFKANAATAPGKVRIGISDLPKLEGSLKFEIVKTRAAAFNVIGIIPGNDKELRDQAIVIGAHYDHLGHGGDGSLAPTSNAIHHGADDNASGTSSLIELARQFAKSKKNRRTLIFISFGGEEEGLLGSKAYVNNPVFPIDKTIAMINMDMVGRLKNEKLTIGGIGTADIWKDLVEKMNDGSLNAGRPTPKDLPSPDNPATGGPVVASLSSSSLFDLQLNQDGFGPSDHSSFYGKKIPVLFFFTGTHSDYHKPSDTADKINYEGLAKVNAFVAEIVKYLDNREERPKYEVAKSSAPQGGRRGFNVSLGTIPSYSDSSNDGMAIDGVTAGSPAAKAGLEPGDKIVKLADHEIKNISDFMFVLGEMKAGEKYEIVVVRKGEQVTSTIIPAPRK